MWCTLTGVVLSRSRRSLLQATLHTKPTRRPSVVAVGGSRPWWRAKVPPVKRQDTRSGRFQISRRYVKISTTSTRVTWWRQRISLKEPSGSRWNPGGIRLRSTHRYCGCTPLQPQPKVLTTRPRSSQLSPALKPLQAPLLSLRMLVMRTGTRGSLKLSSKTQRKGLDGLLEQLKRLGPQRLVVSLRRAVEASTLRAKTIQVTVDTAPRSPCPMVTRPLVQRQAREVGGGGRPLAPDTVSRITSMAVRHGIRRMRSPHGRSCSRCNGISPSARGTWRSARLQSGGLRLAISPRPGSLVI
mmetsp:Transcript_24331/g.63925  ORF Transcript_24331/g.63925 Transcript_24331/m.63925 type:complete len:298 (-) Transcript_24331:315-1208(-)